MMHVLASAVALLGAPLATLDSVCDRVAAGGGSDYGPGTPTAPFASVDRLASALGPGDTGCIRGTVTVDERLTRGGRTGAPITLTSEPGQRGRVLGRLWLAQGADHIVVSDLDLDGRNPQRLPSPLVHANDAVFRGNDVTNGHTGICFNVGAATYEPQVTTYRTVIEGNRIHNCGILPAANHDHGVYVEKARDTRIAGNVIFDNADRAINLYPDAQRTTIVGNIIDGNGQGVLFSGDSGVASRDNVVRGNVITNPKLREAVESWYPNGNPRGAGNLVSRNCISGGAGTVDTAGGGFELSANVFADPRYAGRARQDFRLRADSPCALVLESGRIALPARPGTASSAAAVTPGPLAPTRGLRPGRAPSGEG